MLVEFTLNDWCIGIGILVILLPFLWWRKHNLSYLLFFSVFWLYLLAVVQVVVFPFAINADYSGSVFKPSINLIPFYFGSCSVMPELCTRNVIENILLTMPLGFGISFLVKIKPKTILWLSIAIGLGFELVQLFISLTFKSGFRTADINDAIFNAVGAMLGYGLFRVFSWAYLKTTAHFDIKHKGLLTAIYAVAIQTGIPEKSKNA